MVLKNRNLKYQLAAKYNSCFDLQESILTTVGNRLFALNAQNLDNLVGTTIEEYHNDNRSWTVLNATLKTARKSSSAVPVPAMLFNNVTGGCVGVK